MSAINKSGGRIILVPDIGKDVRVTSKLTLTDAKAFNLSEQRVAPSSPVEGDVYLDNGTNTANKQRGLRYYDGFLWQDLNGSSSESTDLGNLTQINTIAKSKIATVVDTFSDSPDNNINGVRYDYCVNNGASYRMGALYVTWNKGTNTPDISESTTANVGSTVDLSFSVDIQLDMVRLIATASTDGVSYNIALNKYTFQSVTVEKCSTSMDLSPVITSGAPVTGTWNTGSEILDSNNIKYRCVISGTPGTWELVDTVTADTPVVISNTVSTEGGTELLEIPVHGNVGNALWLRVWTRRLTGASKKQIPFRVKIYENTNKNGRELVWQGNGKAKQTYLTAELLAGQTDVSVKNNKMITVDELVCIHSSDTKYEIGRCNSKSSGSFSLHEALIDDTTWEVDSLVLTSNEWHNVPWINNDDIIEKQNKILLEVCNNGISTDPNLVFYVQAKAMSLGTIK